MRKIALLIVLLFGTIKLAYADSTFLPALEFHFLYTDNPFIFETSEKGIDEKKYLDFLLSGKNPLGERIALVTALASYFEWMDLNDNPDKDDEAYFAKYTAEFKKAMNKTPSPELILLATLMDDYQTEHPNIEMYDRLATEMPQSLAAQSVSVIAFAYDVLYNRKWNSVKEYEDDYLDPYKKLWQSYVKDVDPEVHENVESWPNYIYTNRADEIPDATIEKKQDGLTVELESGIIITDKEVVTEEYTTAQGVKGFIYKTIDGKNVAKSEIERDTVNLKDCSFEYKWSAKRSSWRPSTKTETLYDENGNVRSRIAYGWNKVTNCWTAANKVEYNLTYNGAKEVVMAITGFFKWDGYAWIETNRMEMELKDNKVLWQKEYSRNEAGELVPV